jgi:hypothetical protein
VKTENAQIKCNERKDNPDGLNSIIREIRSSIARTTNAVEEIGIALEGNSPFSPTEQEVFEDCISGRLREMLTSMIAIEAAVSRVQSRL